MANPLKLVITSKNNLTFKYGNDFKTLEEDLKKLIAADKKRSIDTQIIYIDDAACMRKLKITPVKAVTASNCKKTIDAIYKKLTPAYLMILGAGDIIPFQEINNPAEDEDDDTCIPTDLPYACDSGFSKDINNFTGPSRVVGRLPDIPVKADVAYFRKVIGNAIKHEPINAANYADYFSVTALVWSRSTQLSLQSMFGQNKDLLISPPNRTKMGYTEKHFKPLTHFYNCHGALNDPAFYGQQGDQYPESLHSDNLTDKIRYGTVIAAECCYGAALIDPTRDGQQTLSVANSYLGNNAIAFVGSSTIAYGPSDSQGLADLITQDFIKSVLNGSSTGAALLEARQKFLNTEGPQLDIFELKTLAQFYLLGDPSLHPAIVEDQPISVGNTTMNNRIKMARKGASLKNEIAPSVKIKGNIASCEPAKLKKILNELNFTNANKKVYQVKNKTIGGMQKSFVKHDKTLFRTFMKYTISKGEKKEKQHKQIEVLVVKEDKNQILGYRRYLSR